MPAELNSPVAQTRLATQRGPNDDPGPGLDRTVPTSRVTILHQAPNAVVVIPGEDGQSQTLDGVTFIVASNGARIQDKTTRQYLYTKAVQPDQLPTITHQGGVGWKIQFADGESWITNRISKSKPCGSCGS